MIPNGEKMNWNGHHLVFDIPCRGCFFADKDECPECDEGLWVEDNPSPWHTGTPTEEGWYVCKMKGTDLYETQYFTGVNWNEEIIEAWQKIEPYEASKERE